MFGSGSSDGTPLGADLGLMNFIMSGGVVAAPEAPAPPPEEDPVMLQLFRKIPASRF